MLAPNREVLQTILNIWQNYAENHNLVFSTDPVPAKSKAKSLCGRVGRVKYPDPVQLYGKDLPWVESADHLGHTLHQLTSMEKDIQRAGPKFIDKTVEIREEFARCLWQHALESQLSWGRIILHMLEYMGQACVWST